METLLGKISRFDLVQEDGRVGIIVNLEMDGSGVGDTSLMAWSPSSVGVTDYTRWDEDDRDKELVKIMRKLDELMSQAKVSSLVKMKGVPVEVKLEKNMLVSWRILTEVL